MHEVQSLLHLWAHDTILLGLLLKDRCLVFIVSGLAYGIFGWWGLTLAIYAGFTSAVWPAGVWQYSLYLQRHAFSADASFV